MLLTNEERATIIDNLLEQKDRKIAWLQRVTELNYNTVHNVATGAGKNKPRKSTIKAIATALGIEPVELVAKQDDNL